MAERHSPRHQEPGDYGEEDPLVALARIVSGRPDAGDREHRRTDLAHDSIHAEADLAQDLEAELLSDLQSALGSGRRSARGYAPAAGSTPGDEDYYAAEPEPEAGGADDGAEEYYAADYAGYAGEPEQGYATADEDYDAGEPGEEQAEDSYAAESYAYEPAGDDRAYAASGDEPLGDEVPEPSVYELAPVYGEAADEYGEPAGYADAGEAEPYTGEAGSEPSYGAPAGEVAFGYMSLRRNGSAQEPVAAIRSAVVPASAVARPAAPELDFAADYEAAAAASHRSRVAPRQPAFVGAEGYSQATYAPPYEPEAEPADASEPVPGYAERESAAPAKAGRRAGRPGVAGRGRREMIAVAAVLAVVFIGGAAALLLRSSSGTSAAVPPTIRAEASPTKIPPEEQPLTVAANDPTKLIYERVGEPVDAALDGNAEIMLPRDDEPIADIPQTPQPADEGSRAISRIILPGAPGDDVALEAADPIAAAAAESVVDDNVTPLGPRRVRTVVVRPDGSIVASEAAPAEANAAEPPAVAPQAAVQDLAPQDPAPAAADPDPAANQPSLRPGQPFPRPNPGRDDEPATEPAAAAPATPAAADAPARRTVQVTPVRPEPAERAQPRQSNEPISLLPGNRQAAPQQAQPVEQAAPAQTQVAALPARGGFYVQVGSQPSQEAAMTTYRDLQRRLPQLLGGRQPDIQRADLGARGIFYRVRVGPAGTREEAVRFCESLKASGADCFVAQN